MHARSAILVSAVVAAFIACSTPVAAQAPAPDRELVLEDYSDIVTSNDLGFNDFSGNTGVIVGSVGHAELAVPPSVASPRLHFTWTFPSQPADTSFTGLFESLFGIKETNVTLDGTNVFLMGFPEHSLDLDDIDQPLTEPGGPRRIQSVHLRVHYDGPQPLKLRLELKDVAAGVRMHRIEIAGSSAAQELAWDFRASGTDLTSPPFDPTRAKELNLVIEHRHVGDGVENPDAGSIDVERMSFELDAPEPPPPVSDDALIDLLERRSCEYFSDWSSRKPASQGMPQDRSTFADLLSIGGAGFALPANVICAARGWITRAQALSRVRSILRLLADPGLQGHEPVGKTGFHGFLYHFFGPDGRRKLNFDFPATPRNEALNTVELSTIDTSLAVMGALAAQTYFDSPTDADEEEVRELAQDLYDGVDWPFMLDAASQQLYLGWKPNEARDAEPHFDIPDAGGTGSYSGVVTPVRDPATLDYYTDEALIAILLGLGSTTHHLDAAAYCALLRSPANGVVRTHPGSLFTYEFLRAFLDRFPIRACPGKPPGEPPDDWYANARRAILATIGHAETNPAGWPTYGPDAWGLSAAEGPGDTYHAYGAPEAAVKLVPEEDGTVTYYAMASAMTYGSDLRARALRALRAGFARGHWHPRFGLPDAFNDAIELAHLPADPTRLRSSGPWLQRAGFAIDAGPMLLHLENARSGLIWNLVGDNANVKRGLEEVPGSYDCQVQTQTGPLGDNLEDRPESYLGAFCEDIGTPSAPKGAFVHEAADGRSSAACKTDPGGPFDNLHCFTNLDDLPSTPPLRYFVRFKLPRGTCNNDPTPSLVQGIEFSMSRYRGGRRWEWALQLENVNAVANDGAPRWRVWRPFDGSWQPTGVSAPTSLCNGSDWHTFEMRGRIKPLTDEIQFDAFLIDGISQMPAGGIGPFAPVMQAGEPDRFAAAVQIDSNSAAQPYTVYLDELTLKSAAPDTTIDSGPDGLTNDPTPTFTFSSSAAGPTFECKVDNEAYAPCVTPHTTAALADGDHTFFVRATDPVGDNTDESPATQAFKIDATPPETTIDSGPDDPTNDATPAFTFSASETGSTFECDVDAGPLTGCQPGYPTPTLGDGPHTFCVRATDRAGNVDATPACRTFTIDTTAPAPPRLTGTMPASPAAANVPKVRGSAEAGSLVRLYAGPGCPGDAVATGSAARFAAPGLPVTVGDNTTTRFTATATDAAGNASRCSPVPMTYRERTPPVLTRLRIVPARFMAARRGPTVLPAKSRIGARVSFVLDRRAQLRFTVERVRPGRRVNGRCKAPTARTRRARRCNRYVRVGGSFTRTANAGSGAFRFTGRIAGRRLRPGRCRLVATPRIGAAAGTARHALFRIG